MSDEKPSFAEMFETESVPTGRQLKVGDEAEGTVVHIGKDGVFVDLGGRQQAHFPRTELLDVHGALSVKEGDAIKGFVVNVEDDGTVVLGRRMGRGMSLEQLEAAMAEKVPVEGKVAGVNKGGVKVDLGGLRAFCPIGQLDRHRVTDASVFLQQTLQFHVIEVQQGRDVILSRRSVLEVEAAIQRETILKTIQPGQRMSGKVVRVQEYGAFVDLGGIDGLIPTRELSYDRRRADQVVSVGDHVEVVVLEIEKRGEKTRLTLSLKALTDDPWASVDRVAPRGQVVQGVVRKLMDFGAFVELAPGVEGLLHVSELGAGAAHPSSFLNVGQPLLVTVQSIDKERQRISLAPAPKGATAGSAAPVTKLATGDVVDCVVEKHERFGVFVQVKGIAGKAGRGLIPERETGTKEGTDLKKKFPLGAELKAKVIDTGRLKLSIKALKDDEDRKVFEDYKKDQGQKSMGTLGDLLKGKLGS
ncbi:MAG: S1 RNA-binding domain-containing protein [Myxococcota bacterium]